MHRYCPFRTALLRASRGIFLAMSLVLALAAACAPLELPSDPESALPSTSEGSAAATETPDTSPPISSTAIPPPSTSAPGIAALAPVTDERSLARATPSAENGGNNLSEGATRIPTSTETLELLSSSSPVSPPTSSELPPPTSEPDTALLPDGPIAYVNHGGNLRSAPRVAPDTVIGQVCPGDQVAVLDDQAGWYRLRVVKTMADCVPQRVGEGTEGWMSSSLVTPTADKPEGYPDLPGGLVSAIVRDVLNGHTIEVAVSGVVKRVNLIGVNAPLPPQPDQPGECFGAEAAAGLADILSLDGQFVLLETDETQGELDRQGQLLSYMWLPDGRMVNYEMIARGYAFSESFNLPYAYQEVFAQVGGEAREDQRGVWSPETCHGERQNLAQEQEPDPTPPDPSPIAEDGIPAEPTLPPPPAPMPPPQTPQRDFDRNGDGEVTCEDFTTCDEAFDALDAGYTHLDYDHDGIPCKELCGN